MNARRMLVLLFFFYFSVVDHYTSLPSTCPPGRPFIKRRPSLCHLHIRHIDIRYQYICKVLRSGEVKLFFIDGAKNPAGMLTKKLRQGSARA
jgi:hypothetical protein